MTRMFSLAMVAVALTLGGSALAQDAGAPTCEGCPRMIVIPGNAVGEVSVAVSQTEITFDQWAVCVNGGGCQSNPNPRDAGWGRGNHPVIHVSWHDAQEYVQWLSAATGKTYRLLTESEWEYAAGTFPDVRTPGVREPSGDYAWTVYNSANMTHPVGRKLPKFGLYDMWGNVWEWVEDCFTPRCSQRVLRGGSYNYAPRQLRTNSRNANGPNGNLMVVGFRVATTP